MGSDRLANTRNLASVPASIPYRTRADVMAGDVAGKEPVAWFFHSPPTTQDFQQCRRQHYITISLALALIDTNHHSLTVNVSRLQTYGLGYAQTRGVAGCQNRAVLDMGDAVEKLQDLLGTQHYWQFFRHFRCGNHFLKAPCLFQRNLVDKAQGCGRSDHRAWLQFLLVGQVDLVGAYFLWP